MCGPSNGDLAYLEPLEARLGRPFNQRGLLRTALAHRSFCAEQVGTESNERLEFLGDAVLGLVITARIFEEFPELSEGELAKVRAGVVNATVLARAAGDLGLGAFILLGKGEAASGGSGKPSILADALEAVIAAVYLDGGWGAARDLVLTMLEDAVVAAARGPGGDDYKTRLQELASRELGQSPRYEVTEDGPDHAKRFEARVLLSGELRGKGEGTSKKQAEQAAAHLAWEWLARESGIGLGADHPAGGGGVGARAT